MNNDDQMGEMAGKTVLKKQMFKRFMTPFHDGGLANDN